MEATYFNSPYFSLTYQCRDVDSYRLTFSYLLRECKHQHPFVGEKGVHLLSSAMLRNSLAVAYDLLRDYPQLASTTTSFDDSSNPFSGLLLFGMVIDLQKCYPGLDATAAFQEPSPALLALAHRKNAYLSAKRYNFYQRFVYTHMPTEIYGLEDAIKYQRFRNQYNLETLQTNSSTKSFVYYVIKRIHAKFWKVAVLLVPHMKQLHQDKVEHALALAILKIMCEEIFKSKSNHVEQLYLASLVGMLNDTPEVIEQVTQICPQVVWATHSLGGSLIRHSIMFHCKNSYNFLKHQLPPDKYFLIASPDDDGNNLLHVAGKLIRGSQDVVTGFAAALQMQKDLQWFEEVSTFVRPEDIAVENLAQETPFVLFKNEHKDLRLEAEIWVKWAARSNTIIAAFIFAVVLVMAFTTPGRNNGDETKSSFTLFAVLDVMSLITSATALLLFRSFDKARYAYEDFLHNLPKRLIHGLVMLSLSAATMLIATLYIMFMLGSSWIMILFVAITCLPIALFVTFQLPLLVKLVSSTYGH